MFTGAVRTVVSSEFALARDCWWSWTCWSKVSKDTYNFCFSLRFSLKLAISALRSWTLLAISCLFALILLCISLICSWDCNSYFNGTPGSFSMFTYKLSGAGPFLALAFAGDLLWCISFTSGEACLVWWWGYRCLTLALLLLLMLLLRIGLLLPGLLLNGLMPPETPSLEPLLMDRPTAQSFLEFLRAVV